VRWWPRFEFIAYGFLEWHRSHLPDVKSIHVELKGSTDFELEGFTLRGRADRVDVLNDGRLAIFDYKTGTNPTIKSVTDFRSPQLPLEAALALRGGFGKQFKHESAKLGYVRLRPTSPLIVDLVGSDGSNHMSAKELGEESWHRLRTLIAAYRDPAKDYRSKARQVPEHAWEGDYDHLARVREWSVSDDAGEDP
jgi:ATP-dependent helicase/nuclease subunit B